MVSLRSTRLALLLATIAAPVFGQENELGLKTFDAAWRIVDRQHFDPTFNGVDWQAVRSDLRPLAAEAADMEEVRRVVKDMLSALGQSHFALIEKENLGGGEDGTKASPPGTAGFDVRFREKVALVWRVEPDGPAARAGVRPGWVLEAVDDEPVAAMIEEVLETEGLRREIASWEAVLSKVDGDVGSSSTFTFDTGDPNGEPRSVEIERVERDAVRYNMPGLPTFYLVLRTERFEHEGSTIGVVHFSNWFDGISRELDRAMVALRDCDGIVLDLRGNTGGEGTMARELAGHFFEDPGSIGTMRMRNRSVDYTFQPRDRVGGEDVGVFLGPLVILSDETTGSCSEVFAGGMQALGRAWVIGERSAGAALPATITQLPNGDYLLHAVADFLTVYGDSMEGDGVVPDDFARLDREELLAGRDAPLEAAADWIAGQVSGDGG